MLVGTYTRTVDDKWRLPVPAELLAGEPGEVHQTFYFAPADDHLILFSEGTYKRLAEQLMVKSVMAHRELLRQFFWMSFAKKGTGPYAEVRPADQVPEEPGREERANILSALEAIGE